MPLQFRHESVKISRYILYWLPKVEFWLLQHVKNFLLTQLHNILLNCIKTHTLKSAFKYRLPIEGGNKAKTQSKKMET